MANVTIYPFGLSQETPSGATLQEIAEIREILDRLANLAFRERENPTYKDVGFFPITVNGEPAGAALRLGTGSSQDSWSISPMIDLGDVGVTRHLSFSCGEIRASGTNYPAILFFNESMEYTTFYGATANPRSISIAVSEDVRYARIVFKTSLMEQSFIQDTDSGEYLFKGSDVNPATIKTDADYWKSAYMFDADKVNSRGDFIGWNYALSDVPGTAQKTDYGAAMFKQTGVGAVGYSYSIGKLVELPQTGGNITIEFSCGEVVSSGNLCLVLVNEQTQTQNYFGASANPRSVSVNTSSYTHVRLYFRTANYANCYIKDATNNVMLWEGASSIE